MNLMSIYCSKVKCKFVTLVGPVPFVALYKLFFEPWLGLFRLLVETFVPEFTAGRIKEDRFDESIPSEGPRVLF